MRYTTLRVDETGVVLWEYHLRRLRPSPRERAELEAFARGAAPGVWAVAIDDAGVRFERRPGSRLHDGIPVRFALSPFATERGAFAKPAPPSRYDPIRARGIATLLTSADSGEIFEACVAAVVGWNGRSLVLVPEDRPRVDSVAVAAIREHLRFETAPIPVAGDAPLALVNAVRGVCLPSIAGRECFPATAAAELAEFFGSCTRRP